MYRLELFTAPTFVGGRARNAGSPTKQLYPDARGAAVRGAMLLRSCPNVVGYRIVPVGGK